jgi:hypothetical protein
MKWRALCVGLIAAILAIGPAPASFRPHGQTLFLYFCNLTGQTALKVYRTLDGITDNNPISPVIPAHTTDAVVTPTAFSDSGTLWMVANISNAFGAGAQQLHLDLYTLNPNGLAGTFVAEIDFSGAIGTGASAAVWSAQPFLDPFDGQRYLFAGASADQSSDNGFVVYWTKPTNGPRTTWSVPAAITGTGIPANLIDPQVMYVGGTYYMFAKDETTKFIVLLSGTSATGVTGVSWSLLKSGNWAGWGSGLEAPFVYQFGGTYRILLDAQGAGISYSDATSWANAIAGTWSAKTAITTAPSATLQHGMIVGAPLGYNFLLKRDLDPASNDNDPMWLEKVA